MSHSGDNYEEAVECAVVRHTLPLKEGSGKELRKLHDNIKQHTRALKTLGCDLPGQFLTSMIELKLDVDTLFECQKHSQTETDVPDYQDILDFIDLRAQATEASCSWHQKETAPTRKPHTRLTSYVANASADSNSVVCKNERHPLCAKFKRMSHENKMQVLKANRLCSNCLSHGHFKQQCKSIHKCKVCQKSHHTLLHIEPQIDTPRSTDPITSRETLSVSSNAAARLKSNVLLMTCCVFNTAPDGSSVEERALLDSASSASFMSECLANSLSQK